MKIIELFAGSADFSKLAKSRGHQVFTVDISQYGDIDLLKDIEFLTIDDLPFKPDLIWSSPTCTTYSIAAISHHRNLSKPKSEFASKSDRVVENMFQLIDQIGCLYFVENPRGMFRKMGFVRGRNRKTVSYCSYGDVRMKPTDIFTNSILWDPKPLCKNYKYDNDGNIMNRHCHHESARRGAKTGTQGLKNNFERSRIPDELHLEILISVEKELKSDKIKCCYCKESFQDTFMWWSGHFWFCFNCASEWYEYEEEDPCSCHQGELNIHCSWCF